MSPDRAHGVELLLGVDGAIGQMDFASVMQALQRGYELLDRTAHRVLGDRADGLRWHLTGLRESSALTMLGTSPAEDVTLAELREIVDTFALDLEDPVGRLPEDDVPLLRDLLTGLERTASGSLFTQRRGAGLRVVVTPAQVLPLLDTRTERPQFKVIGSVSGTLESLTVHAKREASLYNDFDKRRVVVSFAEVDYPGCMPRSASGSRSTACCRRTSLAGRCGSGCKTWKCSPRTTTSRPSAASSAPCRT
jgi:hypothetical protein